MAYLGNNLQAAYSSYLNIDDIRASFNGVTTTFPLRVGGASPVPFPINPQQCLISVNGVVLRPDDTATEGFRLVGTDIVFKNAPAGGATFFGIILAGADYINVGANFPNGTATVPSITFDQDTDTGFYRLSSGSAGFTSNGTKTVTFDTSSLTVDVAGVNIRGSRIIDCSNSTGNLTIFGGAGNGANIGLYGGSHPTLANLAVFDSNEHRFRTADGITERLRIDSSGRVGIGTSSPGSLLDLRFATSPINDNGGGSNALRVWTSSALAADTGGAISLGGVSQTGGGSSAFGQIAGRKVNATSANYAGYLQFSVNNAGGTMLEAMRIDSTGRVGIGTSSPSTSLHVSGSAITPATFQTSNADLYLRFVNSVDPNGYIGYQSNALTLWTVNAERLRIDSSGKLLVGSSTARSLYGQTGVLQTEGTGYASSGVNIILNNASTAGPLLMLGKSRGSVNGSSTIVQNGDTLGEIYFCGADGTDLDTPGASIVAGVDATPGSNDMPGRLVFSTTADGAASPTERLRIDSSGRVGIGTSSPENKFEVIGDGNRIVCRNATNGGEARIEAQVQNYTSGSTFIGTAISQYGSTATGTTGGQANANLGVLTFQNTSTGLILTNGATPLVFGTTSVERMRLTGIGTLALGTSVAPIGTHEFCWQGSHRCAFRNVDSTASNCNGLLIAYDNAAPNGNVNDFLLCTDNAATRAAIRSNGGIANFQANNVNLSDINLKKNILPANSTWEHLKQWEIVSYQYKDQSNESDLNFGVIAQQVAEISPEVITVFQKATQSQPDQLGVKEQQMYWMAIKALQEAVDRIETLENKVTALETA